MEKQPREIDESGHLVPLSVEELRIQIMEQSEQDPKVFYFMPGSEEALASEDKRF